MMAEKSFVSAAKKKRRAVFLLKREDRQHGPYWMYVRIDTGKEKAFVKASDSGEPYNVDTYGHIISSGWGQEPPQAIVLALQNQGIID